MSNHWLDILNFWLEEIGPERWWTSGDSIDEEIARRFEGLWREQRHREASDFLASPQIALAAVILFDQFPRNMFRDEAQAFATDPLARAIADAAIARGFDEKIEPGPRQFLYMPFMHSEDLADQDRSVALFERLGRDENLEFAGMHRDLIARFGRFPHRNAALGRETRPEEKEAVEEGKDW